MDNFKTITFSYHDFPICEISIYNRPKNWANTFHKHEHYQIFYVIKGRVQIETEEGTDILTPGMFSVIPSNYSHSLRTIDGYWQIGINIDPKREDTCGINSLLAKTITKPLVMSLPEHMKEVDEIVELFSTNTLLSIAKVKQKLYAMILACIDGCVIKEKNSFENQLANYLYSNVGNNITIGEVASFFSISVAQLERKTQKSFGCGVFELLKKYKLSKAKIMLRDTNFPISVIAEKIGYYDASHFASFFKKETGFSPSKFRDWTGEVHKYNETSFILEEDSNIKIEEEKI